MRTEKWAATEEFESDGWQFEDVDEYLQSLIAHARKAQESQTPMITPGSTNVDVTKIGDYVSRERSPEWLVVVGSVRLNPSDRETHVCTGSPPRALRC